MIPDAAAFRQMLTLWEDFRRGRQFAQGLAPWRNLFSQLRDLRPWGPRDRLTPEDMNVLAEQLENGQGTVRLELELVFRANGEKQEAETLGVLIAGGGTLVSRTRIDGAKYHALLVDIPQAELRRILNLGNEGLVAAESVMHIRPQSAVHLTIFEQQEAAGGAPPPLPVGDPVVAVFDAVPVAGHPLLAGRLSIDDIFGLEPLSAGQRLHGTAMASAIIHGDLKDPQTALSRRVYFVNLLYAPPLDEPERFPDRLPADLFEQAVLRMKAGDDPAAPSVVVVNASLGDRNKRFSGRMSGWARVVDYLAYRYGLLFVISAGNHLDDLVTPEVNTIDFEAMAQETRARTALRASANTQASRRILAPSEAMNALTVGALHADNVATAPPAALLDVWAGTGMCTVSSGLGPGFGNAIKPDLLAPGGRHLVRLLPAGAGHLLRPVYKNVGAFSGIEVAAPAPPGAANPDRRSQTVGTSVAAALMSGLAGRAHEALEAAYDDFVAIPGSQRAVLLKALLVHCARWTSARDLIIDILGPADNRQHVRQKDNVRRYLGFGAVDPAVVLGCTNDRATLWAVGQLGREEANTFSVPLPSAISGKALPHEISATVAWFAPPKVGAVNYRGVRLKLVEPDDREKLAVSATGEQPDINQTHRGTVIHRRWTGDRAAALGENATFEFMVQRQPDEMDDPMPFALIVTVMMPGVAEIYSQVRARVGVQPKVAIQS